MEKELQEGVVTLANKGGMAITESKGLTYRALCSQNEI